MSKLQPLNYKYRIKLVLSDPDRVSDEIYNGHQLYNDLVAIKRRQDTETRRFWADLGGYTAALDALDAAVLSAAELPKGEARDEAWEKVREQRYQIRALELATIEKHQDPAITYRKKRAKELKADAKARGQKLDAKMLAALLDADPKCVSARDKLRLALVAKYEERGIGVSAKTVAKKIREAGLAGLTEHIDKRARDAAYAAYQARGVTAGTRAIITEAHERSLKSLRYLSRQRFKKWDGSDKSDGSGAFGVQIQGGATVDELHEGNHGQVRLATLPDIGNIQAGSRRSGRRKELWVRIGTDSNREPIWAVFLMKPERPLPPDARIVQVKVIRTRVGLHPRWEVMFTMQAPENVYRVPVRTQKGVVAVDIGWRSHAGDLRVGYSVDSRGNHGELCLPTMWGPKGPVTFRETLEHARGLQRLQQEYFFTENQETGTKGGILHYLTQWLEQNRAILPEWLVVRTESITRWRSQHKLNRLVEDWRANRFEGDKHCLQKLDAWRRKWRHLHEWETRQRDSALSARRERYRQVAHHLATQYETIIINNVDLTATRKRRPAEKAKELVMVEDRKRSQAFDAAPGELRVEILRAADKYGAAVFKQPFDSTTCYACGGVCVFDRAVHLHHECEHCGTTWDQDENASRNALREHFGSTKNPGSARKTAKVARSITKQHDTASNSRAFVSTRG